MGIKLGSVEWDTVAWVSVPPLAGLLGGTLKPGLESPPQLDCWVGHCCLG